MKNIDELEAFILKHGENIVDMMGAEIDRIEMKLRVSTLISWGRFVITFIKSQHNIPSCTYLFLFILSPYFLHNSPAFASAS
jgi:hypothetical protein